jgi:hypothetical protein
VTIKASGTGAACVLIEVVQTDAPVDSTSGEAVFQDDLVDRSAGRICRDARRSRRKAVAEQHSGDATFEALDHGSRLAILVTRRS